MAEQRAHRPAELLEVGCRRYERRRRLRIERLIAEHGARCWTCGPSLRRIMAGDVITLGEVRAKGTTIRTPFSGRGGGYAGGTLASAAGRTCLLAEVISIPVKVSFSS